MAEIQLAKNLVMLRKEKGITQDILAEFVGVSKASVSKWETGQSFPDIMILPRIAAYFNCSIDELMGYEAQLDRNRIRKVYFMLSEGFATKPFEEAYNETVKWVKEYYSCYPFLHQMAILLANHYMLTTDEKMKNEVLTFGVELCKRICTYSEDVNLCKDTLVIESLYYMALGKPEETLRLLGGEIHPYIGSDELIAQAHQLTGNREKALESIQVSMYQKLVSILQMGTGYLANETDNKEKAEEIIVRMQALIDAFDWENVHPNSVMSFYYQAALVLCMQEKYKEALNMLTGYVEGAKRLKQDLTLHGDAFFDRVDGWIQEFELGGKSVREKSVILSSIQQLFENPAFAGIKQRHEYKLLEKEINHLVKGE